MKTRFSVQGAVAAGMCAAVITAAACGGGSGASLAKFCNDQAKTTVSPADLGSGPAPASADDFATAAREAKKLAGEAPSSIKDDVTTVYDGLSRAAQHGSAEWEDDSVQAAWQRVATFVGDKCS